MKKISFNEGTFSFDKNRVTYEIPLEKTNIQSVEEIQYIKDVENFFPVTKLELTANNSFLFMEFEVENGFLPISVFKSNSTDEEKYEFVKNICAIATKIKTFEKIVTVFDDRNILVNPGNMEIKFLYRGVKGLMPAASYEKEAIESQIKRIALYILTTAKYDEIRVNGLEAAINKTSPERYRVASKILTTSSINDLFELMEELLGQRKSAGQLITESKKLIRSKLPSVNEIVEDEINETVKTKRFGSKKKKRASVPKKEKRARSERSEKSYQDTERIILSGSRLRLVVGTIIGAILITFVIFIFGTGKFFHPNVTMANTQSDDKIILKALQYAAIQDYKNAADNFEKLKTPFNKLSKDNKRAILFSYLMTGRYQKAIEIEPQFSYSIMNYLVSKNDIEAVKNINSKEPVIIFEKAAINNDYQTVLKYKDKIDLDGRRESIVADAYIALNQLDQGIEFAKNRGNQDLLDKMEALKGTKSQEQNGGNQNNPVDKRNADKGNTQNMVLKTT